MERKLKRYLTKSEVVHHINGNKLDNRIENLMLFATTSDHRKFHIRAYNFLVSLKLKTVIENYTEWFFANKHHITYEG